MEFEKLGARALVRGLAAKRWTSEELTRYFLSRVREVDATFHSVAFVEEREAVEAAAAIDERRARGEAIGALEGLPLTVKDAFRVAGRRTTYGMFLYRNHRPKNDSLVIEAIRGAGGVIFGRTAVPTACFDYNCKNQVYAECLNPRDPARTPGGSSGGSAAALALGITPLEIGSDLAGSIRYPAHCCGVFGLRTTEGWLPSADWGPDGSRPTFERFGVCGPMARSLDDLALFFDVLEARFPQERRVDGDGAKQHRIAFTSSLLGIDCDAATKAAMDALLARLANEGHAVERAEPSVDYEALLRDFTRIVGYEYARAMPWWLGGRFTEKLALDFAFLRKTGEGPFREGALEGASLSEPDYQRAVARIDRARRAVDDFFAEHDAWIAPCSPSPALPLELCGRDIPTPAGHVSYSRYLGAYLAPTAAFGTPALAFPLGEGEGRLPIGAQMHAARWSDRRLLSLARDLGLERRADD